MPAAKEQGHNQRRDQHHADILTNKEHAELHAGIFHMITIGQFLLGFRLIKRVAMGDRNPRDQEGTEAKKLRHDEPQAFLSGDDLTHVK